jgi:hypothetical protein
VEFSYGSFTREEIEELPMSELIERGRLGRAGSDMTVMFSELPLIDRLFLQKQQ